MSDPTDDDLADADKEALLRWRLALGAICHLRQTQQIKASKERTARRESTNGFRKSA